MPETGTATGDLTIVGAGVAGCALVAALRRQGWTGSIVLIESGRGPGGRGATRRSRHDSGLHINHGAPLFNLRGDGAGAPVAALVQALHRGGWIRPCQDPIRSLDDEGQIGPALDDGFSDGALWQGQGAMDQLAQGLLQLAAPHPGTTTLRFGTLVRRLQPSPEGWTLLDGQDQVLAQSRWLVLSGTLLAHPRCQQVFGWDGVPLQQAAAALGDPLLDEAAAALALMKASASSNLLLSLPPELARIWREQPWRLLQFNPQAQRRWGLRRVSLQQHAGGRWAVVAESSAAFAEEHLNVYGSRSSAAQLLGAAPSAAEETAAIAALEQALQNALGLPTAGAERQLMRWGAAFAQPPGLAKALQLCPDSRIGFCGDFVATEGFGRIEGAIASAMALAAQLKDALNNQSSGESFT
ncbi:MAG: NAD(P)-binding protein [Cyanobacteriota bacterium]|nr:NAD(P)-binding protein [Cyanobacteriota bacterium]